MISRKALNFQSSFSNLQFSVLLPQYLVHDLPHFFLHLVQRSVSPHQSDPVRLLLRKLEIAVPHHAVELDVLVLEPRFILETFDRVTSPRPSDARSSIDIEQDRKHRPETSRHDTVKLPDVRDRQPPPVSLVGERRIGEAVAQDDPALCESGEDHLAEMLRAARRIQEELRRGVQPSVERVQEDPADLVADGRTARFPGERHRPSLFRKILQEAGDLGRLAGALDALKGDERSRHAT